MLQWQSLMQSQKQRGRGRLHVRMYSISSSQPIMPLTWCGKRLALVQGPACSRGRLSLGWLWKREGEEKMGQHAA
eukprot:1157506-Pelagomonas_calceolata.AAC.4